MSRRVSIFVPAPEGCMGFIIGREGRNINQLQRETHTIIRKSNRDKFGNETGFTVTGTEIDCEAARQAIQRRIEEWKEKERKSALAKASGSQTRSKINSDGKRTIEVPKIYAPFVIGKKRKTIETIATKSGTKIIVPSRKDVEAQAGDMIKLTIIGKPENCIRAEWLIEEHIITHRDKEFKKKLCGNTHFVCIDVNDENETFQLKVDDNSPTLHGFFQGSRYRIITDHESDDEFENKISDSTILKIKDHLSVALGKLNINKDEKLMADLWCHFGKVFVSHVDEEETEPGKTFTRVDLDRRIRKLFSNEKAENTANWEVSFEGGVDPSVQDVLPESEDDEDSFPRLKLLHTQWRYDVDFRTPSYRSVRMKAWRGLPSGNDDQPPGEVKNILTPVVLHAEEDMKAWLCYPSVTILRGEIITPNSPYDCRIKLRMGFRSVTDKNNVSQEEDKILSDYLSHCKLDKKDDNVTLCLPDKDHELPEGFRCTFYREAKERMFSTIYDEEPFTVIVLDEKVWDSDGVHKRDQNQFGIRVVMNSWSEALLSPERQWTPKEILDKLNNYMELLYLLKDYFFKHL